MDFNYTFTSGGIDLKSLHIEGINSGFVYFSKKGGTIQYKRGIIYIKSSGPIKMTKIDCKTGLVVANN
ncbi:MAG: hypothetical protein PHI90_02435 [Clostridia bacterium]|nr:hypothetical protein [Clostridia bacterium]MDD4047678.1 hypothetical protein [Clostridia bacterium]